MAKAMCVIGIIVAIVLILLFGADTFLKVPFRGANMMMNVSMMIAGVMLAYSSWAALREQK
jgi:hypothetical protein